MWISILYTRFRIKKYAKEIACGKRVLVVTVNYNISVNNFGAKKSAHFNCALVLTEVESFKRNAVYKLLHGTISENTEVSGYHADTPITIKAEASSKADSRPD